MATDINLQPTDRCVLDYGTTSISRAQTVNKGITLLSIGGVGETMLYKGSTTVTFDGEVQNVTIYKNSSSPSDATFFYSISGNKVTFNCRYSVSSGSSTIPTNATVSAVVYYTETTENKKEVFQIKDNNGNYKWLKCKPVTINFDTNMVDSIECLFNTVTGGSSNINIDTPNTFLVPAGGYMWDFGVYPKDGYNITSGNIADIDLDDVANLTLDDFEPLTINITAESNVTLEKPVIAHTLLMPTSSTITLYNPNSVVVTYSGTTTLSYGTSSVTVATWSGTLAAGATTTKAATFVGDSGSHTLATTVTFTSGAETVGSSINDLIVMPASIDYEPQIYLWKEDSGYGDEICARITNNNDYAVTVSGYKSEYDRDDEGGDIEMWGDDYSFVIDANSYKDTVVSGGQVNSAYYYMLTATFTRGSATSGSVTESVSGGTTATSPDAPTSILDPEECAATITMLDWTDESTQMADWEVEVEWYNPNSYSVLATVVIYDAESSEKTRVSSIETGANTQGSATLTVNGASQDAITIDVYFNRDNLQSNIVNFEDTLS